VHRKLCSIGLLLCCNLFAQSDTGAHTSRIVTADADVKLEVLDWGGSGRPLILLAGNGDTAHVFDKFAPKLIGDYHVFGITRRGFGVSSRPAAGYSADRLGDDVLAVVDALKLKKPILAGHSIAGEELSSIGSRYPDRVAALIYLDAAYAYAYYDPVIGDQNIDLIETQRKLELIRGAEVKTPGRKEDLKQTIRELLERDLPNVERELKEMQNKLEAMTDLQLTNYAWVPPGSVTEEIRAGEQKYRKISGPVLAIYALPHDLGPNATAAARALDETQAGAQARAFEKGVPYARVVRLPNASHYVFRSNEADVIREIKTFVAALPNDSQP